MVTAIPDEWQWPGTEVGDPPKKPAYDFSYIGGSPDNAGLPDEYWYMPGTEAAPKLAFHSIRSTPDDYRLRMVVQDLVAVYGSTWVAVKLADIAEELIG